MPMSREDDWNRISALAGLSPDGSIMPPGTEGGIDRSAKPWWGNVKRVDDPIHLVIAVALTEWRDARKAILLVDWSDPATAKANTALWVRLGHAEAALMTVAKELP